MAKTAKPRIVPLDVMRREGKFVTKMQPMRPVIQCRGARGAQDYTVERVRIKNPPSPDGPGEGYTVVDIVPEAKSLKGEVCTRFESDKNKGRHQLRECHLELFFVGKKLSAKKQIPPGPYMRACTAWGKPGFLIPVRDHDDAQRISKAFCACRFKKGKSVEACMTKVGGGVGLGDAGRRRPQKG